MVIRSIANLITRVARTSLLVCLLIGFGHSAFALEVTATVDKNPVMMDEAITLSIVATGDVDRDAFDSSVLLGDFIVGNTSVSSQTRMVNFDTTQTTTWRTTLFPKKEGRFTIPAITIDGESTSPIRVEVIPVPDVTTNEQRDFFVTAELEQASVYVQQHVKYVVRLHMASNIERGSLQAPEVQNASVEQVGEDKQYSDIVNGKRFQVIERSFVIVPEKSGEYVIQAPIFSGEVIARNTRQSFGFFNRTQTVTRRGPQLSLTVNPIPESFTGDWLPSEYVELNEEWSNDGEFIAGEPITRTITLTVAGQNKEQLPELNQVYPLYVKNYPDQPSTASVQKDGVIVSQRQESTAIIPSESGVLVIPGVDVTWFNTRTEQVETVSIPAKSYTVQPATAAPVSAPQQVVSNTPTETSEPLATTTANPGTEKIWMGISGGLAAVWVLTLIAWWRARTKTTAAISPQNNDKQPNVNVADKSIKTLTKQLTGAISGNSVSQVQSIFLAWLRSVDGISYVSLPDALNRPANQKLRAAYNQYLAGYYGESTAERSTKNNDAFTDELHAKLKQQKDAERSDSPLQPLYKH